ncbi:hypothetical protein FXB38_30700 [Bradyrhizobium cytisi]|uniref:Uncharacterized protein n=2 Tax=Bradyrhizobium cytisi TaxID=515489 RepID=A0A5S4WAW1_9BRAD|nr:hypothetical protein FXB38_30700 [Bradyrhizobium cytisi]
MYVNQCNDDQLYVEGDQAKEFIKLKINEFFELNTLGPAGVLQQADIIYHAWKKLKPPELRSLAHRLAYRHEHLSFAVLYEIGKRHARAEAALLRPSASAQLYVYSQPSEMFDRFLAKASQHDDMDAGALRSALDQSRQHGSSPATSTQVTGD